MAAERAVACDWDVESVAGGTVGAVGGDDVGGVYDGCGVGGAVF